MVRCEGDIFSIKGSSFQIVVACVNLTHNWPAQSSIPSSPPFLYLFNGRKCQILPADASASVKRISLQCVKSLSSLANPLLMSSCSPDVHILFFTLLSSFQLWNNHYTLGTFNCKIMPLVEEWIKELIINIPSPPVWQHIPCISVLSKSSHPTTVNPMILWLPNTVLLYL